MKNSHHPILDEVKKQVSIAGEGGLILACSGGRDSIALGRILVQLAIKFSVAHVNFELRGEESDGDEAFVKQFADDHQLSFTVFRPAQSGLLRNKNEGTQEWARRARYFWFNSLLEAEPASFLLLAHHQGDQAETIMHQFIRGGGLASLTGMKMQTGRMLRPMLHISSEAIAAYARDTHIQWREDASNATNDYTRNFLRHEVLPQIRKINPAIDASLANRAMWFRECDVVVEQFLENEIRSHVFREKGKWTFDLNWIEQSSAPRHLFWKILESAGFKSAQVEEAMLLLKSESGKHIRSTEARLWKDRDQFILDFGVDDSLEMELQIDSAPFEIDEPIGLKGMILDNYQMGTSDNSNTAHLDLQKISWPLVVRRWKDGDRFQPFGMKGQKKISDFLIQEKIPVSEKGGVWVLCSGDTVLWVIGLRLSERARIADPASGVLKLIFIP